MKDASEYGTFSRELGELVREELGEGLHLCDAGCGLGYLSLEMAGYSDRVTAADFNPDALAVLRRNVADRKLRNIRITEENIFENQDEKCFDGMVFCLMGEVREVTEAAARLCRGKVMMVNKNYNGHRFSVGTYSSNQFEAPEVYLQKQGIPCIHREIEIEYGQPFRNMEDAVLFYRIYSMDQDKSLITEQFVREKLITTGDPLFPLYLPHKRQLAMTVWEASAR